MISKIRLSSKPVLKTLLKAIELDTRSTTGKNLRGIMLLVDKINIGEIEVSDADSFPYFPRPKEEWKTEALQAMLEERESNSLDSADQEVLNLLCTE